MAEDSPPRGLPMASSRFPSAPVLIPAHIQKLAETFPGQVVLNLRPSQFSPPQDEVERLSRQFDEVLGTSWVAAPLRTFLREQVHHNDRLLILFQGKDDRINLPVIGVCCVNVRAIYWSSDEDLPRLDSVFPVPDLDKFYHYSSSLWGSYILAVMKLSEGVAQFCIREAVYQDAPNQELGMPCAEFVRLVTLYGVK